MKYAEVLAVFRQIEDFVDARIPTFPLSQTEIQINLYDYLDHRVAPRLHTMIMERYGPEWSRVKIETESEGDLPFFLLTLWREEE